MAIKRITKRWLLNSFAVIVFIIVLVATAASYGISEYYYSYVEQTLSTRADNISQTFTQYSYERTSSDLASQIQNYVTSFQLKDSIELMIIDGNGQISITSSGFSPDDKNLADYEKAISSPNLAPGVFVGKLGGERVMALTVIPPLKSEPAVSGIRLVTSLSLVDRQLTYITGAIGALALAILSLILISSYYFLNSIVKPVGQIGETARAIAGGDFGARLKKRTNDEVGDLCDTINFMAEELGDSEKIKNEFISSVSHELRTPLTAIQGWGETVRLDGGEDKEMLSKAMDIIINETHRLSTMVEELLDFSRMQSGRLKLVFQKIDIAEELRRTYYMYTQKAHREDITLSFDDKINGSLYVYGDSGKLRQVFINVIDNAVKYSESGDSVSITFYKQGEYVFARVTDTGIGIKEEDIPHVKTKFYKANSTKRGSGIGLAVADEIVTRHGGDIEISSVYKEGTEAVIRLPVYSEEVKARLDSENDMQNKKIN